MACLIHRPVHEYDGPVRHCVKSGGGALRGPGPSSTHSTVAPRDPDEFFESYRAMVRSLPAVTTEAYATFDAGSAQAKFLRYIGRHSRISQADLARATMTDPTLTGRVLETLVERGWVRPTTLAGPVGDVLVRELPLHPGRVRVMISRMKIDHVALWTRDLERLRAFYEHYFGARAGGRYENPNKHFTSYFLTFDSGPRLELMHRPGLVAEGRDGERCRLVRRERPKKSAACHTPDS